VSVVIGPFERRLTRLEAEAGIGKDLPTIFVTFASPDGTDPPASIATGNGCIWHREPGEATDAFLERVGGEARPMQPGCVVVVFLE
jgi:hypothetical protein